MRETTRLGAAALIALACFAVLGLAGWHAWTGRQSQLRDTMAEMANLAASLAQHAQDTVEIADAVLSDVVRRAQEGAVDGTQREAWLAALGRSMAERSAASSRVRSVAVTGADGAWIASSLPSFPAGASSAGTAYFDWHRDHPDQAPRVGMAQRSPATGQWTLPVTRRIDRLDGSFGGVAVTAIDVEVFQSLYRGMDLGRQGAAGLLHENGTVLVREPSPERATGRDVRGEAYWRDHVEGRSASSFEYLPTLSGPVRLGSIRRTGRYGLIAFVARSKSEALAAWRADAVPQLGVAALLVLAASGLGWRLVVQAGRRRRLERDAARTLSGYRLLADNATDLIVRLDADMRRTYVSPAARRVMGLAPEVLLGGTPHGVVHADDCAAVDAAFAQARSSTAGASVCYRARHGSGCWIWLEASIRRVPGEVRGEVRGEPDRIPGMASGTSPASARRAGEADGYVVVIRDVSQRKEAELELAKANRRLETLARQDGLTGLANRHHLDEVLDREYRRAARNGTPIAVLLLDVDRFKAFNDLYGHQGGDDALRRIAGAVSAEMHRPADLAARYGGEELAVLLPETDLRGAAEMAERVRAAVRALGIVHAGSERGVATVSVGVAAAQPPPGCFAGNGRSGQIGTAALVAAADQALYAAKHGGRDQVCTAPEPAPAGSGLGSFLDAAEAA